MRWGCNLMAAKNEAPLQTAFTVAVEARDGVTTGISAHDRAHTIQVGDRPRLGPARPGPARPRLPAQGQRRRRAGARRADRGLGRPRPPRRPDSRRRHLRDHERRRHDGAGSGPRPLLRAPRLKMITVADLIAYRRRTEKLVERVVATALPTEFGDFTAVGYRSLVDDKHHVAMVKGEVDGADRRAGPRAQRVPHRRRLPQHALRLRRAAGGGADDDRARGTRRPALPLPGGTWDRPAQQAARLQAPGGGRRHGRGQPEAGPAGRPARLRDRRPDSRRPRPDQHPHPHQQPEKDRRPRGLRPLGHRAGADRGGPQRPQRGLPAGEAGQDSATPCTTRASPSTRR